MEYEEVSVLIYLRVTAVENSKFSTAKSLFYVAK